MPKEELTVDVPVEEDEAAALIRRGSHYDRINLGGDKVTVFTAHIEDEHQRKLVRWVYDWAQENEWGWKQLGQETKIHYTTLLKIWTDKYRNDKGDRVALDDICKKLEHFRRLALERKNIRKLPFVSTSIFKSMEKMCEEALVASSVALIYGHTQIGKTASLQEIQRQKNHGLTLYVEIPTGGGIQMLLRTIAKACRISPDSCFDQLRERVFRALDDSKLLIIDETNRVFETYRRSSIKPSMELIRELYDRTHCGLVLVGDDGFRVEMEQGEYSAFLRKLKNRAGGLELQLPKVAPREDLDAIADVYGLGRATGEAEECLLRIAKESGLGKYIRLLARSVRLAQKKGQKPSWAHFVSTYQLSTRMLM